jgi:hypothetical protein
MPQIEHFRLSVDGVVSIIISVMVFWYRAPQALTLSHAVNQIYRKSITTLDLVRQGQWSDTAYNQNIWLNLVF